MTKGKEVYHFILFYFILFYFILFFYFLFFFLGANKTEHLLTDGEEQHGSIGFLKRYPFYILHDKAQVKN